MKQGEEGETIGKRVVVVVMVVVVLVVVVVGGGGDSGGGLVFKTKGARQHMSRVPELTKAEVREAQRTWVWSELYKWCQSS